MLRARPIMPRRSRHSSQKEVVPIFERFTERARAARGALARPQLHRHRAHPARARARERGVAARILLDFDADAEKIRGAVIQILSGPRKVEATDPTGVIELIATARKLLPYLQLSTEEPKYQTLEMPFTPAERLRREAGQIERRDKAIVAFRKSVEEWSHD